MITGVNGLFFTPEPEATRAVLTEILPFEVTDAGDGWLVFDIEEVDLAVHPLDDEHDPFHQISFTCDDIERTVETIEYADLEIVEPIEEKGFGKTTVFELPGGVPVELYEPIHE